jgi:hypothetical protein
MLYGMNFVLCRGGYAYELPGFLKDEKSCVGLAVFQIALSLPLVFGRVIL